MFLEYLFSCRSHIDHRLLFFLHLSKKKEDLSAWGFTVVSPHGYDLFPRREYELQLLQSLT